MDENPFALFRILRDLRIHVSETRVTSDLVAGGIPKAGIWTIDSARSFVTFSAEYLVVAFARGLASGPTGDILIGYPLTHSSVKASISTSTFTTGNQEHDAMIRSAELLDVERFGSIDFESHAVWQLDDNHFYVDGSLTIRDVSQPVTLFLTFYGVVVDPWGNDRLGLTATTELSRTTFGLGDWGNTELASGGHVLADAVSVTIDVEATRDDSQP
jgi:polyisoprenoid-binding protein YceI